MQNSKPVAPAKPVAQARPALQEQKAEPLDGALTKEAKKTKKIQNEIAKEIKARGIDQKAAREVDAKEKQKKL